MTGQTDGTTGREGHSPRCTRRFYHDPDGPARVSTSVVHALADAMGIDVTRAERELAESVHPRGLDAVFPRHAAGPPGHVAFTVDGYDVTVYSTGEIVVTAPPVP